MNFADARPTFRLGIMNDDDLVLDSAAFLLAEIDRQIPVDQFENAVKLKGEQYRIRIQGLSTPYEQAEALGRLLFESDFRAVSAENRLTTDMVDLMQQKAGSPLTLAILYASVARHAGVDALIMNFPRVYLIAIGPLAARVYLDPSTGEIADEGRRRKLVEIVSGITNEPQRSFYEPLSVRSVLRKLLLQQATAARKAGDLARALTLHERICDISPGTEAVWWERARLEQLLGRSRAAHATLSSMLELTKERVVRQRIHAALGALARAGLK